MILKVVRGDYFPGLVNYIMRFGHYAQKGDTARVIRCHGLYDPRTAAAQLAMQAAKAPTRTKRAIHFIGRAERMLTDGQYVETAEAGMAVLGLAGRPYLLVVHPDGGFHCATVEIDEHGNAPPRRLWSSSLKKEVTPNEAAALPPGDVVSRSWDGHLGWRLTKLARSLEIKFGLQQIGRSHDSYDNIRMPDWQLRLEGETGLAPLQELLGDEIKAALDLNTWEDRADALAVHGLGLRAYAGANGRRRGLVVYALGEPKHLCKGSSLGKAYGLGALEKRTGETIDCWLARHSLEGAEDQAQPVAANPTRTGGEALKSEFDALRDECLGTSKAEAKAARMHRQRMGKVRMTVALLRERLLATGQVCKSWARLICSLVRAELRKKIMRLRDLDRQALPHWKRPPSWREFLKGRAATNPVAQALLDALEARRRTKAAPATTVSARVGIEAGGISSAPSGRNNYNDRARTAASLTAPLPSTVLADENAARKKVLDRLWHKLVGQVRLDGADDVAGLVALVRKRQADALNSLLHPSMARERWKLCSDIHRRQLSMIDEVLTYIRTQTERADFQPDRIIPAEGTSSRVRGLLDATFHWPEVQDAIELRLTRLSSASVNQGPDQSGHEPGQRLANPPAAAVSEELSSPTQTPTPHGSSSEAARARMSHEAGATEVKANVGMGAATTRQTGTAPKSVGHDAADRAESREQPTPAAGRRNQDEKSQALATRDVAPSPPEKALTTGPGTGLPVRNRPTNPVRRALADAVNKRRNQPSGGAARDVTATRPVISEAAPNGSADGDGVAPVGDLAQQFGRQHRKDEQRVQATGDGTPPASLAPAKPTSSADIAQVHQPPLNPQPSGFGPIPPEPSSVASGGQAPGGPELEQTAGHPAQSGELRTAAAPELGPPKRGGADQEQTALSPSVREQARELVARRKQQGVSTERVRSRGPGEDVGLVAAVHAPRKGKGRGR